MCINNLPCLQEIKDRIVTYAIPGNTDMKWSVLFTKLELNSADLGIEDYTISNASLAQVILMFDLSDSTLFRYVQNIQIF